MNARLLLGLAMAFATLAIRWLFVWGYGVDIPYWDQWDSPYADVVQGYYGGQFDGAMLFRSHNEHRPATARALTLSVLWLFGDWRPIREMALNSLVPAICAGIWAWCSLEDHPRLRRDPRGIGVACIGLLLFASPMLWRNMLWSFQLPIMVLCLAAFVCCRLAAQRRLSACSWALILGATLVAQFSLASGALVCLVAGAMRALQAIVYRERKPAWEAAALISLGLFLPLTLNAHVPAHEPLRIQGLGALGRSFLRTFGWPNRPFRGAGLLLIWLPLVVFAWRIRQRLVFSSRGRFYLGLSAFVALNGVAYVLLRGGAGHGPAPRHVELFLLGFAPVLWIVFEAFPRQRGSWRKAAGAILVLVPALLIARSCRDFKCLGREKEFRQASITLLREVRTIGRTDPAGAIEMLESVPMGERIYPTSTDLYQRISDPNASSQLPAAVLGGEQADRWIDTLTGLPGVIAAGLSALMLVALFLVQARKPSTRERPCAN